MQMQTIWDRIIEDYLVKTESYSELQFNGTTSLFCRKDGKRLEVKDYFSSVEEYTNSISDLVDKINPDWRTANPNLEALEEGRLTLSNGNIARVHIVLPPASFTPQITIAKKSVTLSTLDKITASGSMTPKMLAFIKAISAAKATCILSGSTGSGKTTFLEAKAKLIPENYRIGVVEDAPELMLRQPNVTYLHTKPWRPGMDPNKEVTLDWCVRQINRMRTDILIIGESRGPEFKGFITGVNSGMEGSMTTLHANTPKMALQKATQFVMEAQPQPIRVINTGIASSVDFIIQLEKTPEGKYRTTKIEEISEILSSDESATISTTPLVDYSYTNGIDNWKENWAMLSTKWKNKLQQAGFNPVSFEPETIEAKNFVSRVVSENESRLSPLRNEPQEQRRASMPIFGR